MTAPAYSAPLDEITTALLHLLNASGRKVWDGAYSGDPLRPAYPYGILYALPGGSADPMPDLDGDWRTVTAAWQVSAVSNYRNQAQRAAREFTDRLLARTPAGAWVHELVMPDGWACVDRRPDPALLGVERTGDPPRAVFTAPARVLLTITPA